MPIAAAAVPALIGAAGSIGGALLSSHKSSSTQGALSGLGDLLKTQVQGGQAGLKAAEPLLASSGGALGTAQDYLQSLLGGGQSAMEAAAPEINTILSQYDTAKRSLSQFAPRGGGTNATLAELPFKESGAITNLLAGERGGAARSLASLGLGEAGTASSLLPRPSGAGSSLLQYGLGEQRQQGQMFGQAGSAVGSLLGTLLPGGWSGSSTSDYGAGLGLSPSGPVF